jgi:hypothetical protein
MFSFYIWVCKSDSYLLVNLINNLHFFYPNIEIIVISDGDIDEVIVEKLFELNVIYYQDEHRKFIGNNANFLYFKYKKLLELSDSTLFIKLDPDSKLLRQFTLLKSDWFGQIFKQDGLIGTYGCAMGISRATIIKLLGSIAVERDANFTYTNSSNEIRMSEDIAMAHYLNQLNMYPDKWNEVNIRLFFLPSLLTDVTAIIHPCIDKSYART